MRDIWVVSDTHFGHANILKYCDRPFASVAEMNEAMIDNWNSVVKDNDIVYHLGDVFMSREGKVLDRLKGRKRLILGNHDADPSRDDYLRTHFQKVMVWRMFPEFGLVLTHVPIHESGLEFKVSKNVHGHIHDKLIMKGMRGKCPDDRYINVSVEHINYTPVPLESLRVK